jgi:hypothetical protein
MSAAFHDEVDEGVYQGGAGVVASVDLAQIEQDVVVACEQGSGDKGHGDADVVLAVGQFNPGAPKDGQSWIITNGAGQTG